MKRILILPLVAGLIVWAYQAKAQLHSAPSCGVNTPASLTWGTDAGEFDWTPTGNLTYTATNVDGTGHTFTYTFSGNTATLASGAPYVSTELSAEDAITLYTNGLAAGTITLTIDISPAITGDVGMSLYHINGSSGSGGDKFTIHASHNNGAAIYPTFTEDTNPSYSSNATGELDSQDSGSGGTAGVNWSTSFIDQIVIVWDDCGICGSGFHGAAIGGIDFCGGPPCNADAGQFTNINGCAFLETSTIAPTHDTNHNATAGFTQTYALTNASGVIQDIATSPSFPAQSAGNYQVYAINYEDSGGISNYSIGNNISTVTGGCLVMSSVTFSVCACHFTANETITFNAAGGDIGTGSATTQYALTDAGGIIQALSSNTTFAGQTEGIYNIFAVTYDTASGISNLAINNNISTVTGSCADISNALGFGVCGANPRCGRYEAIIQN